MMFANLRITGSEKEQVRSASARIGIGKIGLMGYVEERQSEKV